MSGRCILKLTGSDVKPFLQGLITNDIARLKNGLIYAALLTPQGKYVADFFLCEDEHQIYLDVGADLADTLIKRLTMYKLRSDVTITYSNLNIQRGTKATPSDAFHDPRHSDLGWRKYSTDPESDDGTDWDAIRVTNIIPETGIELTENTFILEARFEALFGVDFNKGCYVGQEVTARMKHKSKLRKGLTRVAIDKSVPVGTDILSNGKKAGTIYTQSHGFGIAHLYFDRSRQNMLAEDAKITWKPENKETTQDGNPS
ncbi:MAG: folate-binding protein [Aestuariivita sp.]|nr:folate-binding protein [Aestuariivita sp.]